MSDKEVKYAIAEELRAATDEDPQQKNETLDDFKLRLVEAVDTLSDDAWDELSATSRHWVGSLIRAVEDAMNEKRDPVFPLFPEEVQQQEEQETVVVDNSKGNRVRQQHKPPVSRAPKKSKTWDTKVIICKNPNISYAALRKELEKLGYDNISETTLVGQLSNVRQDLKVLQSLNMLKTPIEGLTDNIE